MCYLSSFMGIECMVSCNHVFEAANSVVGFHSLGHVTKNYLRSVSSSHGACRTVLRHVACKKNLAPNLRLKKQNGPQLFEIAVRLSAFLEVEAIKQLYGPNTRAYLGHFEDS